MKKTLSFLLMLVMVATVFSCKKKDPELTPAQKIVGKYKNTASTSTISGVTTNDLDGRPACQADDISEFTSDGKLLFSEGATSCTPPNTFAGTGTYILSADGKSITITFTDGSSSDTQVYTVQELTGAILKLSTSFTFAGITATSNITLTKI